MLLLLALTTCGRDSPTKSETQAPARVSVMPSISRLVSFGQTVQLSAAVLDRQGGRVSGVVLTWSSSDASIASVTQSGLVTALRNGTVTIRAAASGLEGRAIVTVAVPIAATISVTPDTVDISAGQTHQLVASVRGRSGQPITNADVSWSSSDASVATVSDAGLITALRSGKATITAAAGETGDSTIVLVDFPAYLWITSEESTLAVSQFIQLTTIILDRHGQTVSGAPVTWSSDNESIATVDGSGRVTGVRVGTTSIKARSFDQTAQIGVKVTPELATVLLSVGPTVWLEPGETLQITARALDADGKDLVAATFEWMSSDLSVATIGQSGLLTAVRVGTATVSVSSGDVMAQTTVTVFDNVDRQVLAALYQAADGDAWNVRDGWMGDASIGDWHGITTDGSGRVTRIELGDNNLSGSLTPALSLLDRLILLDLQSNLLTGTIPSELGDLARLDRLYLNDNQLEGTLPIELTRLDLSVLRIDATQLCVPEHSGFLAWLEGIGDARHPGYCENPDREILTAFFNATSGWKERYRVSWLTDAPLDQWHGVQTDRNGRVTGLITGLGIGYAGIEGPIPPELGKLTYLKILDLSSNRLTGTIPPELGNLANLEYLSLHNNELSGPLPSELGRLVSLETLYIYYNENLDSPIPPEFGNLTKLDTLVLAGNALTGPIPPELGSLTQLRTLSLWGNNLNGSIPPELGNLENLVHLALSENDLDGPIPPELGNLSNLAELYLSQNRLSGSIPDELSRLRNLDNLDLTDNDLQGTIPPWVGDLPELVTLYLNANRFSGTIPPEIGALDNLVVLNLSDNQLNGSIPPELGNLSELAGLYLSNNQLSGMIPPELGNLPVIRWSIDLSSNALSGSVPGSLGRLSRLRELHLNDNGLFGLVPVSLSKLQMLETLRLDETDLCVSSDAAFQAWLEGIANLSLPTRCENADMGVLITLYNVTDGPNWTRSEGWMSGADLGDWYGVTVDAQGRVTGLSLAQNGLKGPLPGELGLLDQLTELHLAVNDLSGSLPDNLGSLTLLRELDLRYNRRLRGALPADMSSLSRLESLRLDGTDLCVYPDPGTLSWLDGIAEGGAFRCQVSERDALAAFYELTNGPDWENNAGWNEAVSLEDWHGLKVDYLDRVIAIELPGNNLWGPLPRELDALSNLEILNLSENELTGQIPPGLGDLPNLKQVSLRENRLTGPIPPELGKLSKLSRLTLHENRLSGPIPPELGDLKKLTILTLHENQLSGAIPHTLGDLDLLEVLTFNDNAFTGTIPSELGRLTGLTELPLHENQLSGPVPAVLGNLSLLKELTLQNNHALAGPLPLELTRLDLENLQLGGTQLCAPASPAFKAWLLGIPDQRVASCAASMKMRAYLVQAVQSLDHPVPLVAGERALLRVFITAESDMEIGMPAIRAAFYHGGVRVHTADVPGTDGIVPSEIDEGSLETSVNVVVPPTVVEPDLEMVIEVDPEGLLDPAYEVSGRYPESGRMALDVASVPPLDLTMVPFLWREDPDPSILGRTEGLTSRDELFWPTRDLLPVGDFTVRVRDFAWSFVDPVFENVGTILRETRAIQASDGAVTHYMAVLRDLVGGQTALRSTVIAAPLSGKTLAHELGHSMSLKHAPCTFGLFIGGISGADPYYPYPEGNIGTWGYDFTGLYEDADEGLVEPGESDLMGYCGDSWVSDYHFTKAFRYRVTEEVARMNAMVSSNRSLLLWGGAEANGDLLLEPAFVVDAAASEPVPPGPYRLVGADHAGGVLFTMDFSMNEHAHGGGGSFAFAIPAEASWPNRLARITLDGPGGAVTIDGRGDRAMAMLRDSVTGQVRGFLRDLPVSSDAVSARRVAPEPGLEVVISRGVPDWADW